MLKNDVVIRDAKVEDFGFILEANAAILEKNSDMVSQNEEKLKKGFKKYLKEFRKATLNSDQKRYEKILKYSSLQYFKDRLQIK